MTVPDTNEMAALETMIDYHGLFEVLVALDVICGDKAAHIRANAGPGDEELADWWDSAASEVRAVCVTPAVEAVSP